MSPVLERRLGGHGLATLNASQVGGSGKATRIAADGHSSRHIVRARLPSDLDPE
jgi:hypothetical protein